jgi:hypothetical protein
LRDEVDFPESRFEHVLLASANAATRSLDVVFWAFQADPYAFRVCREWQDESWTYIVVNGVLAETTFSDAIRLDGGYILGRPTRLRSYRYITPSSPLNEGERIRDELFFRRSHLYRQANDFIERRFDEIVIERLQEFASLNARGDHRVKTAVMDRLQIAFNSRIQSKETRAEFDRVVGQVLVDAPDEVFLPGTEDQPAPAINWRLWLDRYRQCLDALLEPFGLPGDVYQTGGGEICSGPLGKPLSRYSQQRAGQC